MVAVFIVLAFITIGCDSYICLVVAKSWPLWGKLLMCLPTLMFFAMVGYTLKGNWGWSAVAMVAILLCCVVPKVIFCVFSLLGKCASLAYAPASAIGNSVGLAIGAVVCICVAYGMIWGWKRVVVKHVVIESETLPKSFDGYKIAQISDLHLGTFQNDTAHVGKIVDRINALSPDIIVFTGDLVNFCYEEAEPFKQVLSRLSAEDGVLSILGNHDYAQYGCPSPALRSEYTERLVELEKSFGWNVLRDENIAVTRGNERIWIAGVRNVGRHSAANIGNLRLALDSIPPDGYVVLLSHDPTHWSDEVLGKEDIALTLSGHTHAMQTKVFGWSPSSWLFDHWGGHYQEKGQHLYVSVGTGGNMPFRFGAWPEITIIELKKKE